MPDNLPELQEDRGRSDHSYLRVRGEFQKREVQIRRAPGGVHKLCLSLWLIPEPYMHWDILKAAQENIKELNKNWICSLLQARQHL